MDKNTLLLPVEFRIVGNSTHRPTTTPNSLVEAWPVDPAGKDEVRKRRRQGDSILEFRPDLGGKDARPDLRLGRTLGRISGRRPNLRERGYPGRRSSQISDLAELGFSRISDPARFLKPTPVERGFPARSGWPVRGGRENVPERGERERESVLERGRRLARGDSAWEI